MSGTRVGFYLHQEGLKGGCLVKVETQTDFCARTDEVKNFATEVAKLAFGAQSEDIKEVFETFPHLLEKAEELSETVGETIVINEIRILT